MCLRLLYYQPYQIFFSIRPCALSILLLYSHDNIYKCEHPYRTTQFHPLSYKLIHITRISHFLRNTGHQIALWRRVLILWIRLYQKSSFNALDTQTISYNYSLSSISLTARRSMDFGLSQNTHQNTVRHLCVSFSIHGSHIHHLVHRWWQFQSYHSCLCGYLALIFSSISFHRHSPCFSLYLFSSS